MSSSKLQNRLLEDVVILENGESRKTGAQVLAPDHSPREAAGSRSAVPRPLGSV